MNFHNFIRYVMQNSSDLSENIFTSFFNYVIIVFGFLLLYVRFFKENHQFYQLSFVILDFIIHMFDENLQFYHKMCPVTFQLYINGICMPIILSEFSFSKISSDLKIILCYPQIYHKYIRWKYSVLYKNVSTSLFNYIPIVFVSLSLYLRFF